MSAKSDTVNAEVLTEFAARALQKVGVPEEDARITARILVATDLRGIDSHGTGHLANYVRGVKEGRTNPNPETKIFSQAPATAPKVKAGMSEKSISRQPKAARDRLLAS